MFWLQLTWSYSIFQTLVKLWPKYDSLAYRPVSWCHPHITLLCNHLPVKMNWKLWFEMNSIYLSIYLSIYHMHRDVCIGFDWWFALWNPSVRPVVLFALFLSWTHPVYLVNRSVAQPRFCLQPTNVVFLLLRFGMKLLCCVFKKGNDFVYVACLIFTSYPTQFLDHC